MLLKALSKFGFKESLLLLLLRENKKLKATIRLQQSEIKAISVELLKVSNHKNYNDKLHKDEIKKLKDLNESAERFTPRILSSTESPRYA